MRAEGRKLIFQDGSEYLGESFGKPGGSYVCELVFNTSPAGYQEIMTDPSYTDQFVVMANPLIGNTGINEEDSECAYPGLGGFVVRTLCEAPSNFRSRESLSDVMEREGIPGLSGVDTRALVRKIRREGSQRVLMTEAFTPLSRGLEILRESPIRRDAVSRVSRRGRIRYMAPNERRHIALIDLGMKENILRSFLERDCGVSLFPWNASPAEVLREKPDALFLSNGPGDPTFVTPAIELVRSLAGQKPILGICLGHQIISLALGAKTYKLKFGHRGGNHPVLDIAAKRILMTSQNHSYAVDEASLEGTGLLVTHKNLLDQTVEGVMDPARRIMSVQFHPESAPGPCDSRSLFDDFVAMMDSRG